MSTSSRPKRAARPKLTFFDERLRYSIPEAAVLLRQSISRTWADIAAGKLAVIRESACPHEGVGRKSGRVFVPGSEIAKRSTLPERQAGAAA
ncbi:MAG: hypothetical protein WBE92_09660 [Steroidobacteraceae bacterium]